MTKSRDTYAQTQMGIGGRKSGRERELLMKEFESTIDQIVNIVKDFICEKLRIRT